MEDKNKELDKLIRDNMEEERPSLGFSDKIMDQIHTYETAKEKSLGTLLQKHILETPSTSFTDNVMAQIQTQESEVFVYKPVISKKVWFAIVAFFGMVVVFSLLNLSGQEPQIDYLQEVISKFDFSISFKMPHELISPIFALSLFALSLFLWIDYFIHNRYNHHKIKSL